MTPEQIQQLKAPLDRGRISTRKQGGTELSYLEGWDDIATANRIFGYDQWDRELVELTQVEARDRTDEEKKGYRASYHAKVRVTVHAEDRTTVREGIGSGHGYGYSLGEAVESAVKEAETDAMKRALSTWGNRSACASMTSSSAVWPRAMGTMDRPERRRSRKRISSSSS